MTTRHAPPDLTKTVEKMQSYFNEHKPNQYKAGRKTAYSIPDMLTRGQGLVYGTTSGAAVTPEGPDEPHNFVLEGDDLSA